MRFSALILLTVALGAAEERIDGGTLELPAGRWTTPIEVSPRGASLHATAACELAAPVTLLAPGSSGVDAAIYASSLRGVEEDDWRIHRRPAGRHHDSRIDIGRANYGTPEQRRAWGIQGSDDDWDDFSVQWDGILNVPEDGTELATTSDDGSRVWLDLDGDGKVGPGEWGDNGWGGGQGATQRVVHHGLHAGLYRLRVQWEDGGGPDCCVLRWNLPGRTWETVPDQAFRIAGTVLIGGPVTIAGSVGGHGDLRLAGGVRLAVAPTVDRIAVDGVAGLAADLDLSQARIQIVAGGFALAGHRLRLGEVVGEGGIDLAGGILELAAGDGASALAIDGPGEVRVAGSARVRAIGAGVRLAAGCLRSPERVLLRKALAAPLTTVVPLAERSGPLALEVGLVVPPGAADGLGIGAWRADRQGRWFQRILPGRYGPGRHHLRIDLGADAGLVPVGHAGLWQADTLVDSDRVGLFLFSARPATGEIAIDARLLPASAVADGGCAITDLRCDGAAPTGQRWSLSLRPQPYPAEPGDPAAFALDLAVVQPDGSTRSFAGFHDEPVVAVDRGDREEFRAAGDPCFRIRFRPVMAGTHRLRLTARWAGRPPLVVDLPDLQASGPRWDGIVRADADDPRFFSVGGRFVWPAGCNLNSTYDVRSRSVMGTLLTPDRGSFTRQAFLERLAAGGGTACEVWLSPWNLGLEWSPDWPGYRGTGRYHPGHAAMLDRLLDRAEQLGIRVNLSLFNHGMARAGPGAEQDWEAHPYSREQGGWLAAPDGLFTDPRAFACQQRLFRYLAARYGDSPAVLGWKLWAEVDLVQATKPEVADWHRRASAALAAADPWHHPITTHWAGDWHRVDPEIAVIPDIGYLTIDAYKGDGGSLVDLLCASTRDPRRGTGLARHGKPVLVTEFGGSAGGTARERMRAEHASGPWAGLVSGHAGAPMLWWFEWIDQEDRFGVYGAISRFVAGEDLRDRRAACVALRADAPVGLWSRAWLKPGRVLGYVLDQEWGAGGAEREIAGAGLAIGPEVRPGAMLVEWWDADRGGLLARQPFDHRGGALVLHPPAFRRHLAFKLMRADGG